MNLIEETLMAGFPPKHYDIVWIRHDDKDFDPKRGSGRLELNYHIVNRDLVTQKKISPYVHKYDIHRVNLAKQIINDKFGYSSPNDPARARQINLMGYGSDNKGKAKELTDFILKGIQTEQIDSRDDIIKALQSRDDIEHVESNKSETFLIVKMKGASRNLRLKGTLYGKQFTSIERLLATTQDDSRQYHQASEQRLASNIEELQRLNANRAKKRQRLIEPQRKRGRKTQTNKHGSDAENSSREQEFNNSINQQNDGIAERIKSNSDRFEAPNATTSHDEQRSISRQSAPNDRSREVPKQMPVNGTDSVNNRNSNWLTFTVLTYIQKPKYKEHDSKENTNTTGETLVRTRATIEAGKPTNGRDSEPERHQLGVDLGSIQRAAIYARDFIARIIKAVRRNLEVISRTEQRAASERTVTKDYEQLNSKCDKLNRLLREKTLITLDVANEIKAEQSKSTSKSPNARVSMTAPLTAQKSIFEFAAEEQAEFKKEKVENSVATIQSELMPQAKKKRTIPRP